MKTSRPSSRLFKWSAPVFDIAALLNVRSLSPGGGAVKFQWDRLLRPTFVAPVPCAVNDTQDRDGLMSPGFIAKGIGDDIGHTAHKFFISAGHPDEAP